MYFQFTTHSKRGRPSADNWEDSANKNGKGFKRLRDEDIDRINKEWADTEQSGTLWEVIKEPNPDVFMELLATYPELAHLRSKDGRGPMFWAHEFGRKGMVQVLRKLGVREDLADAMGIKPTDITHSSIKGSV